VSFKIRSVVRRISIACLACTCFATSFAIQVSAQPELPIKNQSKQSSLEEKPTLIACATCGCSELCSISVADDLSNGKGSSSLTDSIWGNMILKMAYDRDPELRKYRKRLKLGNNTTSGALMGIACGTLAQTTTSLVTLNPPEGMTDSYAPGFIGLTLDVCANVIFSARAGINYGSKKAMRARQLVVKRRVESILDHLEKSQTECAQAQSDLTGIIGERAARDCIQLWQSSHELAQTEPLKISDSSPLETSDKLK
jgi:hypothetical protein